MTEKKELYQFISLLPMPTVIIDYRGIIIEANNIFKEKFNFNKISKKNKIKLQTFFNFDITNILKRLSISESSVSTYDYKFTDLDENEITVDLHFNSFQKKKILMILHEKDNFKTYLTQVSKTFGDMFMNSFSNSLGRNISSPITNILAATSLYTSNDKNNTNDKILTIIKEESSKIKSYINKINQSSINMTLEIEKANIHKCLYRSLDNLSDKYMQQINIKKSFDPSIPEVYFNNDKLIKCFENILINSFENKMVSNVSIITKINHSIFIRSEELQKVLKLPIHIKFIDDGPEINEDLERFMFYPFVTNKNYSEGLGLTFVNLVVSKYGGYLKYEREQDKSSFNIYLPLVKNRRSVN